jgi:hypothetical protein
MNEIIKRLKSNYLFQASLGSKELFHSNLLAWILEQRNTKGEFEVLRIFVNEFLKDEMPIITNPEEIIIAREEKKIDLIIKWRNGENFNYVFIENKLKSIPTITQLTEYDDVVKFYSKGIAMLKIEGELSELKRRTQNKKFLLTPTISNLDTKDWNKITYKDDIIPFLIKIKEFEFEDSEKAQIRSVIEKYIQFLNDLLEVLNHFNIDFGNVEKFKQRKYDFYFPENYSILTNLRLHDFVLKLAHSYLQNIISNELEKLNLKENRLDSAFSNSTGITTVDFRIGKSKFFLGLQLQGLQLRYFLLAEKSKKDENIQLAKKLFESKLWFHDIETGLPLEGNGRSKKIKALGMTDNEGKPKVFCEYSDGVFLYFYKDLAKNENGYSINELIELIMLSIKRIMDNESSILKLL